PTRRTPRAAVRQVPRGEDPCPAPRAGPGLRRPPGRRQLAPGRPCLLRADRVRLRSRRTSRHPGSRRSRRRRALFVRVTPLPRGRVPGADRRERGARHDMIMSSTRVRAIYRKELREYRRTGAIVATMAVIPLGIVIFPLLEVIALPASAASRLLNGDPLVILL